MDDPKPPRRRRRLRAILLGTEPGLERLLLAIVPAVVAGSVAFFLLGPVPALAAGVLVLAIVVASPWGAGR